MVVRYLKKIIAVPIVCIFFSCGIENYVFLEPVEIITTTGSTSAHIVLPNNSGVPEFRYYAIFYRIYLSDTNISSFATPDDRTQANSTLASHYNSIYPYTTNNNTTPSAVGTIFSSLNYYHVYVRGSAGQIVSDSEFAAGIPSNSTIDIVFANEGPTIEIPSYVSGKLALTRSNDGFTVLPPDRTFFSSTDLLNAANIVTGTNSDVEKNPKGTSSMYSYVSMYIAAAGIDSNFTAVYSSPRHIGIFTLPPP